MTESDLLSVLLKGLSVDRYKLWAPHVLTHNGEEGGVDATNHDHFQQG